MNKPPFSIGLRLTLARGRDRPVGLDQLKGDDWTAKLQEVAGRERTARHLAPNTRPSSLEAEGLLARTFADHPMVNVGGRAESGTVERGDPSGKGQAFVLAEVIVLPDFGPIPPGGEFPDVTDEVLAGPLVVHARLWPESVKADDETTEAQLVLEEISSKIGPEIWRRDG